MIIKVKLFSFDIFCLRCLIKIMGKHTFECSNQTEIHSPNYHSLSTSPKQPSPIIAVGINSPTEDNVLSRRK